MTRPLTTPSEYLADVPRILAGGPVHTWLAGFAQDIPATGPDPWVTHVAGHPPGMTLVFVLLGTGAVFAGATVGSGPAEALAPTPSATTDPPRPLPSTMPAASRLRTCSVAGLATDPRLMAFEGLPVAEVAARVQLQVAMVYVAKSKVQKMLQEEIGKLEMGA